MKKVERSIILLAVVGSLLCAGTAAAQAPGGDPTEMTEPAYTLGPSDVVRIWVFGEPDLAISVAVRPDGRISVPLAGTVSAAGRSTEDVEAELKQRLATYLGDPVVVVIVQEINSKWISVLGEVGTSGRFAILQRLTVVDAIALAGGFSDFANTGDVHVIRQTPQGPRLIRVDVKRLLEDGTQAPLVLQPGDTVYVRE